MKSDRLLASFVSFNLALVSAVACAGSGPGASTAPVSTQSADQTATVTVASTLAPTSTLEPPPGVGTIMQATPSAEPGPHGTLALVNGTLVDGTGAGAVPDAVVVIRDGRIAAVGARPAIDIPQDARVIDVNGSTILPGFFNAHVHRGYDERNLQAWARAGVTTVRDLGTSPEPDPFPIRDSLLKNDLNARLVAAGPMLTVPGGYPMVPWGMQGLTAANREEAVVKADQLIDHGAEVIKISLESGRAFGLRIPVLSPDQAAAIVQVAHERGVRVSAHITSSQDLPRVLDAGVDDIAHMPYDVVGDDLVQRIVEANIYWVPTLELWQKVGVGEEQALDTLRRFVAAGGRVALGTDYAGYTGAFDLGMPMREIEGMSKAGMTPMQIIVAGTRNAAHVSNVEDELGTLEVGKIADLLVVNGNPWKDLRALTSVHLVVHDGVVIREAND